MLGILCIGGDLLRMSKGNTFPCVVTCQTRQNKLQLTFTGYREMGQAEAWSDVLRWWGALQLGNYCNYV